MIDLNEYIQLLIQKAPNSKYSKSHTQSLKHPSKVNLTIDGSSEAPITGKARFKPKSSEWIHDFPS